MLGSAAVSADNDAVGKLIAVALAAVALFFAFHSRDAKAAKVTSCLRHAGAVVRQSTFLEDHLSTPEGRAENSKLAKKLQNADKNLWDVELTDDHGMLMRLDRGYTAKDVQDRTPMTVQGKGNLVMLWYGAPSEASRRAIERCLG
jgi:hypothetical protein